MFDKDTNVRYMTITNGNSYDWGNHWEHLRLVRVDSNFFNMFTNMVFSGIIPESIMYPVYGRDKLGKFGPMPGPAYFISQLVSDEPVPMLKLTFEDQEIGDEIEVKCTLNQRFLAARQTTTPSHKKMTEFYTVSAEELKNGTYDDVWLVRMNHDCTKSLANFKAAVALEDEIAYGLFTDNEYLLLDNGLIAERSMDYPW